MWQFGDVAIWRCAGAGPVILLKLNVYKLYFYIKFLQIYFTKWFKALESIDEDHLSKHISPHQNYQESVEFFVD